MAKGERQDVEQRAREDIARSRSQEEEYLRHRENERGQARARYSGVRDFLGGRLSEFADTGGYDDEARSFLRSIGAGGTGQYDPNELNTIRDYIRTIGSNVEDPERMGMIRGAGEHFLMSGGYSSDVVPNTFRTLSTTGGFDPSRLNYMADQFGEAARSGGFDPTRLRGVSDELAAFSRTGGIDPAGMRRAGNMFTDIYQSGGFDPNSFTDVRGRLQGFADSGGVTPTESAAMIRRATRGVSSVYDALQNRASRIAAATGGYGGGGEISRMARQAANEASEASIGAESEVGRLRQQGRMFGVEGLRGLETDIAGLTQRGRIAGAQGFGDMESRIAELTQRGRMAGLSERAATERALAQLQQEGTFRGLTGAADIYGRTAEMQQRGAIEGARGIAGYEADAAAARRETLRGMGELETAASNRRQQADIAIAELFGTTEREVAASRERATALRADIERDIASGRRSSTEALARLAELDQNEAIQLGREILERINIGARVSQADLQILAALSSAPGLFDNIMRAISAGSAAVSAAFGGRGIPGLGGGSPAPAP